MRLIQNIHGISRLFIIVLLLVTFVFGVVLSYVWTMSYYAPKEFQLPSKGSVTVESVEFSPQNASCFNVTILNPSLSPSSVSIDRIAVLTAGDVIYDPLEVLPFLPWELGVGVSQTFECDWNWANFTNQRITVLAWVDDGSGATLEARTPFVGLAIFEPEFDSSISIDQFNVTVRLDSESSATHVNVTSISLNTIPSSDVEQGLPYTITKGQSAKLTCSFNWTDYQGESVTVAVETLQGHRAERSQTTPEPVVLTITEPVFNATYLDHFNITVQNGVTSPSYVTITEVWVTVEDEFYPVDVTDPLLPQQLLRGSIIPLKCYWDWNAYKNKAVTVTVFTSQGFIVSYQLVLPTTL